MLILISFLVLSPKLYAQVLPATCDDLVTNIDMWGRPARGVDLRAYTNSTLHWIGCPSIGCAPDNFFCDFDPNTQTLTFGTTGEDALRAAVDPGNEAGDTMPNTQQPSFDADCGGCCCDDVPLFGVCNAPDSDNNGVPIDAAEALCNALGYESGSLTEVDDNSCPEANAITADGSDWTSDFVDSEGYGRTYTCVGFRAIPTNVPTLSEWGLIAMAGILGIVGFMVTRRRKAADSVR